jgi:hypothetical protein
MKKPNDVTEATDGGLLSPPPCLKFLEFPKMPRLSRECIITEKLDGTNSQILITDDGQMLAGSRTRWITPEQDNYGFARWAWNHREELLTLGPGRHWGEWWGQGIQRKYGMTEKRWSLFNVSRWCLHGEAPQQIPTADPRIVKMQDALPPCCHLVPVLYRGQFTTEACEIALAWLRENGSAASPGFSKPEGIVCFHVAGNVGFKKTLEKDETPKTLVSSANFAKTCCDKTEDRMWHAEDDTWWRRDGNRWKAAEPPPGWIPANDQAEP